MSKKRTFDIHAFSVLQKRFWGDRVTPLAFLHPLTLFSPPAFLPVTTPMVSTPLLAMVSAGEAAWGLGRCPPVSSVQLPAPVQ